MKLCQNGREAVDVVHKDLVNQRKHEYDYVQFRKCVPKVKHVKCFSQKTKTLFFFYF